MFAFGVDIAHWLLLASQVKWSHFIGSMGCIGKLFVAIMAEEGKLLVDVFYSAIKEAVLFNERIESYSFWGVVSFVQFCAGLCYAQKMFNYGLNTHWLNSLVASMVCHFGGKSLTAVLLGQSPSWIASSSSFPAAIAAWYTVYFGSPFVKALLSSQPIKLIVLTLACVGQAHAVTSGGSEYALSSERPDIRASTLAVLLCGATSASGGEVLCQLLGLSGHKHQQYPVPALRTPSVSLQCAAYGSLLYFLLTDPLHRLPFPALLDKAEGKFVISAFIVFVKLSNEYLGVHPLSPINYALGALSGIRNQASSPNRPSSSTPSHHPPVGGAPTPPPAAAAAIPPEPLVASASAHPAATSAAPPTPSSAVPPPMIGGNKEAGATKKPATTTAMPQATSDGGGGGGHSSRMAGRGMRRRKNKRKGHAG